MKNLFTFLFATLFLNNLVVGNPLPAPTLSTSVSDVWCFGGLNGSIDLTVSGGVAPYTYLWSNGATAEDVSDLFAGTYSVTVTDANGANSSTSATVNEPAMMFVTASSTDVTCNGGSDGSASVSIIGGTPPYLVLWSTGNFGEDNLNIPAGDYFALVQDNYGCLIVEEVTVNEPAPWSISIASNDETCASNDGNVSVSVSGGAQPYSYSWSNGGTSSSIGNLAAGSYTITITDGTGCTATSSTDVALDCITCSYVHINTANFDNTNGFWTDPGADCQRAKTSYANSPKYALKLKGGSSTSYTETYDINLTNFSELTVEFSYITNGYGNGHAFYFELSTDGGSSYSVIEDWYYNSDFVNGQRHNEQVVFAGPFTPNTKLRIRSAASNKKDELYIDDIEITGCYINSSNRLADESIEEVKEEKSQAAAGTHSIEFDGSNSFVTLGTNYGSDIVTFELMFKPNDTIKPDITEVQSLIIRDTPNQVGEFGLYFSPVAWGNPGKLAFYMMVGGQAYRAFSDGDIWIKDQWYHVACVNDSNSGLMKMYVNGILQSQPEGYQDAISSSSNYSVALGQWGATSGIRNFNGKIDEVRIWNTIRNANEVGSVICQTGNETGLIRYWRFDEGTGTTTYDMVANAPAGIQGQAAWSADYAIDCSTVTSIDDHPGATQDLLVYPNPTTGKIYLKGSLDFQTIIACNALGQEVLRTNNVGSLNEIDLSSTNCKGLIFLKFADKNQVVIRTEKVVLR